MRIIDCSDWPHCIKCPHCIDDDQALYCLRDECSCEPGQKENPPCGGAG